MVAQVLPGRRACCRGERVLAWSAQVTHWSTQRVGFPPSPLEIQPLPSALWIRVISCREGASYTKPLCADVVSFTISVAMVRICAPYIPENSGAFVVREVRNDEGRCRAFSRRVCGRLFAFGSLVGV